MSTTNYNFPEIDPTARFDGANDINKLADAIDTSMKQVEILGKDAQYELRPATRTALGGIRVGANVNVSADGTISTNVDPYVLPAASNTTLGGVAIPADSGITLKPSGEISIDDKSITLPVNSVNTAQLIDGAVTTEKIAEDAVTFEKLAPTLRDKMEQSSKYARGTFENLDSNISRISPATSNNFNVYNWGPIYNFEFNNFQLEVPSGNTKTTWNLAQFLEDYVMPGDYMVSQPTIEVKLSGDTKYIASVKHNPEAAVSQRYVYLEFATAPAVGNYTISGTATMIIGASENA